MMSHLSLSDRQIQTVLRSAEHVPDRFRCRFLEAVPDRLLGLSPPTDEAVLQAVTHTAFQFNVNLEAER